MGIPAFKGYNRCMNRFIRSLAEVCREHLLTPKRLLCPRRRIGDQWVRQVVRSGCGVVQLWVCPLKTLAVELAESRMSREEVTLISPRGQACLVEKLFRDLSRKKGHRFLAGLADTPGLAASLGRTVADLRMAGVSAAEFSPESFAHRQKGKELAQLLAEYERELKRRQWIDDAELFLWARDRLIEQPAVLGDVLFLVPEPFPTWGLSQQLLDQLPLNRRVALPGDEPGLVFDDEPASDIRRLRFFDQPELAPALQGDGTVRFVQAVGEGNEVRQIFRSCLKEKIHLDEVEILYTDRATYVPLLYEVMIELQARQDPHLADGHRPWVNFADGLPAMFSRPGRALSAWLDWIKEDYDQSRLVAMLSDRLLELEAVIGASASPWVLAERLQRLPIGWGRERYRSQIDRALAACSPEDETSRQAWQALMQLLTKLLRLLPAGQANAAQWLTAADQFLELWAAGSNELDNFSREKLRAEVADQRLWLTEMGLLDQFEAADWLAQLPAAIWVDQQGPMPGMMHAASWEQGGHSGRPHTFLLGMDEKRLAWSSTPDPLLDDVEKQHISPELLTSVNEAQLRKERWQRFMAGLQGKITLSFSMKDMATDADLAASPAYLAVQRLFPLGTGDRVPSENMAGYLPGSNEECLFAEERWWLRLPIGRRLANVDTLFARQTPHLAAGWLAEQQRQSNRFTEYDGWVPELGRQLFPEGAAAGFVFSVNSLELLGRCPLAFFFSKGLGLRSVECIKKKPTEWLPSHRSGQLLHRVFQQFLAMVRARKEKLDLKRHGPLMEQTMREILQEFSQEHPVASAIARARQEREWTAAVRLFLIEECQLAQTHEVMFLESNVGLHHAQPGRELDSPEPIELPLRETRRLRVGGCIDRIDRRGGSESREFVVWDYKTGRPSRYEEGTFQKGRILQHALYLQMAEAALRKLFDHQARVVNFGYFFPSRYGKGDRLLWSAEELLEAKEILDRLIRLIHEGAFLATDQPKDCEHCEFQSLCQLPDDVEASGRKLEQPSNRVLQPMRELRHEA